MNEFLDPQSESTLKKVQSESNSMPRSGCSALHGVNPN